MKNINRNTDSLERHWHPVLVSERTDFDCFQTESRLRELAATIPERGNHELPSTIQSIVSAAIHAMQHYLSQVVTSIALFDPIIAKRMVVSSSGQNVIDWLKRTQNTQGGWIPNYPVQGSITLENIDYVPTYGMSSLVPAITLSVNRQGDKADPTFFLRLSVADHREMRSLSALLASCGKIWDDFEAVFGVTAFTSVPLPDKVKLKKRHTATEYAAAFIKHIVDKADDEDVCLETLDIQFSTENGLPLNVVVCAAVSLLWAHHQFDAQGNGHSEALRESSIRSVSEAMLLGQQAALARKVKRGPEPKHKTLFS